MSNNLEDFHSLVVDAADPDLKKDLLLGSAVWDVVRERGSIGEHLVGEILQRARRYQRRYVAPRAKEADATLTPIPPAPSDLLAAEQMARKLEPWARALRRDRFSSEDAPCSTIEEAADWIERESETRPSRNKSEGDDHKLREELDRVAAKFAEETGLDVNVEIRRRILSYQKPDSDHMLSVYTTRENFLYKLARATEHVAGYTGLTQDVLVVYVLTGLYPVRPRVRSTQTSRSTQLPGGEYITTRWETVTFFAADLTFDELRDAYAEVRKYLGKEGAKKLSLEDVEFWRLVEYELGSPPDSHGEKKPFWEEAQRRWNDEYAAKNEGYTHFTTWEGVRRKHKSLAERLPLGF